MPDFFDKFIADLVKGAEVNSRANGGPGVNIQIDRENRGREEKLAAARLGALEERYTNGAKAAAAAFGVKEAFLQALLPLAGSVLGGTAARAGMGALARGAGGKMLGKGIAGAAGKILPKMTGGIGGAATDAIGGMAGSAVGQKLAPQPQQQQ